MSATAFQPLQDITVIDLTRLLPGPFATSILAELGARVIKVEAIGGSDFARHIPPEVEGAGYAYTAVNRGKESIALDLKTPEGVDIVRRLAAKADALIEGFRPGVATRLGIGPEALTRHAPRLIYASLSGYGATGPLAQAPGHDLNYEALAGILYLNGPAERPHAPALQAADMGGALYAALGIVAALRERDSTGHGRILDLSLTDAALAMNALQLARAAAGDDVARGGMELAGGLPGYDVYETKDGRHLALGTLEPHFWERFIEVSGERALADAHADATRRPQLAAAIRARTAEEWTRLLTQANVPANIVLTPRETLQHPQVVARTHGDTPTPGYPLTLAPTTASAPTCGQHTHAILTELAYTASDIQRLTQARAIGA